MRLGLAVLAAAFLSSCQVPRPVDANEYLAKCLGDTVADPSALPFIAVRLPDCRNDHRRTLTNHRWQPSFGWDSNSRFDFAAEEQWRKELNRRIALSKLPPIIFIHGYNNDANDALGRAHLIRQVSGGRRVVVGVIWPSHAKVTKYFWDGTNADWAKDYLRRQIALLAVDHPGAIVIAHSMGNRILLDALRNAPSQTGRTPHLGRIIMASPDLDRWTLASELASGLPSDLPITLYASAKDRVLNASWRANGYPRAGDLNTRLYGGKAREYPFDGIAGSETIDLTAVSRGMKGHSVFLDATEGRLDLCRLLNDGVRNLQKIPNHQRSFRLLPGRGKSDDCSQSLDDAALRTRV